MAHHMDINKAYAILEGEGWHMEHHREAIVTSEGTKSKKKHTATKRDKRRCIHYNKKGKRCYKSKCVCMGTSDRATYED